MIVLAERTEGVTLDENSMMMSLRRLATQTRTCERTTLARDARPETRSGASEARFWRGLAAAGLLTFTGFGCYIGPVEYGEEAAEGSAGESDSDSDSGGNAALECGSTRAGLAPLRRLNRTQYENTIRDLFGGNVPASETFPRTDLVAGFRNDPDANLVSLKAARDILTAAEDVAAAVVDDVSTVVSCDPSDTCAESFVAEFGKRAFRRPLRADEQERLLALYHEAETQDGFADGIGAVVAAVLQSPAFLYLVEEGEGEAVDDVVQLGDYEIATRLSYLVWDTMPDDALLAAAERGELRDPALREAQVQRLLEDRERSGPAVARFFAEWMRMDGLQAFDKDATAFPTFDETLAAAMETEFERFIETVVWGDEPTVKTLLTGTATEVDGVMAEFFGLDSALEPGAWSPITLDGTQRRGLLTRPFLLAEHASSTEGSVVRRGEVVRTQLLCEPLAPPPANAQAMAPEVPEGATNRERSEILMKEPTCGGCHQFMNPIGLGFEHFDATGAWRDRDIDGSPIDASGEVVAGTHKIGGAFDGPEGLVDMLADEPVVRSCLARHFFRHGFGLDETETLSCALDPLLTAFEESGGDLRELVLAFTRTDAFVMRRLETPS